MTDFSAIRRAVIEIEGPREGSLEARAVLVLRILAVVNAAGVVLALFPPITPVSTLLTFAFNAGATALAVLYWITAGGLARRESWAVAVARPMLLVVLIAGVYATVVALAAGRPRIPFEAVLAGWAFLGGADVKPLPRFDARSLAVLAATGLLLAQLLFGHRVFGWGGTLDLVEADLTATLHAECGPAGAGLPPTIAVTYEWAWRSRTPLPSGIDMVVLGWTGADAEGRPLYIIGRIPEGAEGIRAGRQGYPSEAMAKQASSEMEGSYRWAIELERQRLEPGRIEVELRLAREAPPASATLELRAWYVHLGLWREASSATCTW